VPSIVTGVKNYGVFVDVGGVQALLHHSATDHEDSRLPWNVGDTVPVRLLSPLNEGRLLVSAKSLYLMPSKPRQLLDLGDPSLERLRCYHSKAVLGEAIFGVGVGFEVEDMPNGQQRYYLSSVYDVLAYESFNDGVRRGVWKQKFSEFLPLALDGEHFEQGRTILERLVEKLTSGTLAQKLQSHGKSKEEKDAEYKARITFDQYKAMMNSKDQDVVPLEQPKPRQLAFSPLMLLDVIPKLMNSQVVLLSSGQVWRSQKALEGYFAYHHLLLHCLQFYPHLRVHVERTLNDFETSPENRAKSKVHNLGEFLCFLSVSDSKGWDELGVQVLEEAFARNVLWILKQAPQLGELSDVGVSKFRLRKSFQANIVSLRLLMFQVAFLQLVKPLHVHELGGSVCHKASCALKRKDRCKGLPGPGEAEWLFRRCLCILAVEDWDEFLEFVHVAPMTEVEVCRWLRKSVITSIARGYHNSRYFASLCKPKEKVASSTSCADYDPDDFNVDNRPKESKASKRARKRAALLAQAVHNNRSQEYARALFWARTYCPGGYSPRQALVFISDQRQLDLLASEIDKDGVLGVNYMSARRGYRLLEGKSLSKIKSFPVHLMFGLGCIDCAKAVTVETSGRCMPCCHRAAKEPKQAIGIKGLTGADAPVARFTMFQAEAVNPVVFEMQYEVGFDHFVADVSQLRASLSDDLTVTSDISGITVFSRVQRMGKKLWEKAPEQIMVAGSKLYQGYQGVTDAVFTTKIRGLSFTLLQETMHNLNSLDDLALLKMTRSFCPKHELRDEVTKEIIWDRPCKNCRGVLRLRFRAPDTYVARKKQLDHLCPEALVKRAQLCGLEAEASDPTRRQEAIKYIIKSEKIIR